MGGGPQLRNNTLMCYWLSEPLPVYNCNHQKSGLISALFYPIFTTSSHHRGFWNLLSHAMRMHDLDSSVLLAVCGLMENPRTLRTLPGFCFVYLDREDAFLLQ